MSEAKKGDKVKIHYTGRLKDGTVFDSSVKRDPLEFTIGGGQVIPGFEQAVEGLSAGDTVTTDIPASEAYGLRRDEMMFTVDKGQLPPDYEPELGHKLRSQSNEGQPIIAIVTGISESEVTVDANHPLSGEDLTFDIELVEIV